MSTNIFSVKPAFTACLIVLALPGCVVTNTKQVAGFEQDFTHGHYSQAADTALKLGGYDPQSGQTKDLLWSMQAGVALSYAGNYELSNKIFDSAEKLLKGSDQENMLIDGFQSAASILVNDSVTPYEPTLYDGVMVNTYKAMNFVAAGDKDGARIEFNRADDRQRRAAKSFEERIAKRKEEIQEEKQKLAEDKQKRGLNYEQSMQAAQQKIGETFSDLDAWKAYPDFVNPYTTYLHGLYFFLEGQDSGDLSKAYNSIKRVYGMSGGNEQLKSDMDLIDKVLDGKVSKQKLPDSVWVVFENGLGPKKKEVRIDVPVFLLDDKSSVVYTGIALPKLEFRDQAYPYLSVNAGKEKRNTQLFASMDRVIQTEFKSEYPYVVTRAITGSIAKTYLQHVATEKGGAVGGLLAGIYQAATTSADVRMLSSLPKEVQVTRVRRPKDGLIELSSPGMPESLKVAVPEKKFTIIRVKAHRQGEVPQYQLYAFDA